ncbi:MAG: hypothetical protein LIO79_03870 [Rikenellaceae bacterium]|nr:hypothetical protein [Rikenellaceae bacterium]
MKKFFTLLAIAGLIAACSNDYTTVTDNEDEIEARAFIITASAEATVTGQSYYSSQVNISLDTLKLVGEDYEYGIRINKGMSPILSAGGQYSGQILPQTYIAVDDIPKAMKFGISVSEVDNWFIGCDVTVTVKSATGTILGTKTVSYDEGIHSDEVDNIEVPLSNNQNVTDYVISMDVKFIPTNLLLSQLSAEYIVINNTSVARDIQIEAYYFQFFPGLYTINNSEFISQGFYDITVPANRTVSGNILVDYDIYILSPFLNFFSPASLEVHIGSGYKSTLEATLTSDNGVSYPKPIYWFDLYNYDLQDNYKFTYTITLNSY